MRTPKTADIKGILKVLCAIGILVCKITPPCIWHCGTVGEINGSQVPFEKTGENKLENPKVFVEFWTVFWITSALGLEFGLDLLGT